MTIIMPEGVPTLGNTSVRFVASIADTAQPDIDELTASAPASLDISCFLMAEGWQPGQDVSRGSAPRRLCQRSTVERITSTTQTLADLSYSFAPQAAPGADGKKAYETLTEGKSGFFVERLGLDARTDAWAPGDYVNIIPVTLGPQLIVTPTDEAGEYQVTQAVSVRASRTDNVVIVGTAS